MALIEFTRVLILRLLDMDVKLRVATDQIEEVTEVPDKWLDHLKFARSIFKYYLDVNVITDNEGSREL